MTSARIAGGLLATLIAGSAWSADPGAPAVQDVRVRAVAHFGFDRDAVRVQDQKSLLADVAKMQDVSWQEITVVGHTDSVGRSNYNDELSRRRADAIKAYLMGKGIDGGMVHTDGKGASTPAADNGTPDGRKLNRRAEVEFRGVRPAR